MYLPVARCHQVSVSADSREKAHSKKHAVRANTSGRSQAGAGRGGGLTGTGAGRVAVRERIGELQFYQPRGPPDCEGWWPGAVAPLAIASGSDQAGADSITNHAGGFMYA